MLAHDRILNGPDTWLPESRDQSLRLFGTISKQTSAHQHSQVHDERRFYGKSHQDRSCTLNDCKDHIQTEKNMGILAEENNAHCGDLHVPTCYFLILHSFPTIANVVSVSFCSVLVSRNVTDFCRVTLPLQQPRLILGHLLRFLKIFSTYISILPMDHGFVHFSPIFLSLASLFLEFSLQHSAKEKE